MKTIIAIILLLILISYFLFNAFQDQIKPFIVFPKMKQAKEKIDNGISNNISNNIPTQDKQYNTNASSSKPKIDIVELEMQIHDLVNKQRRENNVSEIIWNEDLSNIARKHSKDMATRTYFSHTSPEGYTFSERYEEDGFECNVLINTTTTNKGYWNEYATGGENLFQNTLYNYVTYKNNVPSYNWNSQEKIIETTVLGWMNSTKGHRENLLADYWKSEGIGVAISEDDWIYITQNFC